MEINLLHSHFAFPGLLCCGSDNGDLRGDSPIFNAFFLGPLSSGNYLPAGDKKKGFFQNMMTGVGLELIGKIFLDVSAPKCMVCGTRKWKNT